jgi:hypothetical protein
MIHYKYCVTQEQDLEAFQLAYDEQVKDPAFCKHVVKLVNAGIRILNRLEKEFGHEFSYDHGVMICPELQDNQDELRDYVESKIQRPLYTDAVPDWAKDLGNDGMPVESELCYPQHRHDYWQSIKLARYEQQ